MQSYYTIYAVKNTNLELEMVILQKICSISIRIFMAHQLKTLFYCTKARLRLLLFMNVFVCERRKYILIVRRYNYFKCLSDLIFYKN